jgi:taurine dioxygenase
MMGAMADEITITPVSEALGAEIGGIDLAVPPAGDRFNAILAAWHDNLVLLFRDQNIGDEAFLAFSGRLGAPDLAPVTVSGKHYRPDLPELAVISNVIENGEPIGALGNAEAVWHTDMSYNDEPPMASLLYAIEIPPSGGNTGFCNMYAAHDALPEATRRRIAGLNCKHDSSHNSAGETRSGFSDEFARRDDIPGAIHPLVCVHPDTGREVLYLGRRGNAYIPELSEADSEALLDELWSYTVAAENTWHHEWRVGDVLLWDNRCTMHRRDDFDPATRRIMYRSQIRGTRMKAAA